jgi:hypothetical protein
MISALRPRKLCTVVPGLLPPESCCKNFLTETDQSLLDKIFYYKFQLLMNMVKF